MNNISPIDNKRHFRHYGLPALQYSQKYAHHEGSVGYRNQKNLQKSTTYIDINHAWQTHKYH
jgi:hypothetical protein